MRRPHLTIPKILAWADSVHERTGKWPRRDSGRIPGSLGETWMAVDMALNNCGRGLHVPGISLAQLLAEQRGVRNRMRLPKFTVRQILAWMTAHHKRTGLWPTTESGPIADAPGETWCAVDKALRSGSRGLAGGSSLSRILTDHFHLRLHRRIPAVTKKQILTWATAHFARLRKVPTTRSGLIPGTNGVTWDAIDQLLRKGGRGLSGGSSLSLLLDGRFPVRSQHPPPLTIREILQWSEAHFRRNGKWPSQKTPELAGSSGVTWAAVHQALVVGCRGLPGGSSLSKLLRAHFNTKVRTGSRRRRRS